MPIDPRIAMGFQGPDIGTILEKAQQLQQQRYLMKRKMDEDKRDDSYRGALGDILTGKSSFDQPADPTQPPPPSAQDRAARADPESYLKFQGQQTQLTAQKLKATRDLNDTAMQLLGGVNDQATYDRAKVAAKVLYQRYGEDPSAIDQLPPEYSPDTVKSLQMQGMDTEHQLMAVARENKLNWDIEDDQADNNRADQAQQNLSSYREQRLASTKREQDLVDSRTRRGQDISSEDRKAAIKQRTEAARNRGTGKPAAVSAGDGAIIRNPKTGQRLKLQNGQWVPIG